MIPFVLLFAAAAGALAPAKLVVATSNGVAITDYPSVDRCERARVALLAAWQKDAESRAPQGYKIVTRAPVSAVCVPG